MSVDLTIKFDSQKALDQFAEWLCEGGEQDYWNWMDCRDDPETATFIYNHPQDEQFPKNDKRRYQASKFCNGNVIFAPNQKKEV